MAFKVLVYHDMPENILEDLLRAGIEIVRGTVPNEETICREIADCDALVAFEQPENGFGKTIIDAAPNLKLIARRGVGYETVDVDYASKRGIWVTNTPAINSRTVAEATILLMLECSRNAQKTNERFRKERSGFQMFATNLSDRGFELTGRTLGLIGCGNVGLNVAQIAAHGFDMKVYAYDAFAKNLPDYIVQVSSKEEIFRLADFVSIHVPSTKETKHSIGMEQFQLMKPGAFLINTARGDVVREKELIEALKTKVIRGAGLDVYASEPISEGSYPLFELEYVELTPHNASFTVESLLNAFESIKRSLSEVAAGKKPTFAVNCPEHPRAGKS